MPWPIDVPGKGDLASCENGAFCAADSMTCKSLPGYGAACSTSDVTRYGCALGLVCDYDRSVHPLTGTQAVCSGTSTIWERLQQLASR